MPIKKSELYSRLWQSCDELRGGMDASEYKNYILVLLFIKYVSDKFAGQPYAEIKVPRGASFKDMVALKGNKDIGDLINKKIVGPLADANQLSDMPDFNDAAKLGSGKEMQERLTNLIAIFEDKAFDFSKNRADGDDILGDAYEYLMRHFATESGKSKGQFYTPAEVSRVIAQMNAHFAVWKKKSTTTLKALKPGFHPKELISKLAEGLLDHYADRPLVDPYDIYQHLMDYWAATMQDDAYLVADEGSDGGWHAETYRVIEAKKGKDGKPGKEVDKGWACDLVPKALVVARFYAKEQAALDQMTAELEAATSKLAELEDEHGGEEGAFSELDKVNAANVAKRLKEIKGDKGAASDKDAKTEAEALEAWLEANAKEADLKRRVKDAEASIDAKAYAQYPKLGEADVKSLVVDDKWMAALEAVIHGETDRISQQLTQRVKELAERYETPLPKLNDRVAELEAKVNRHLAKMGFAV